jgi:DNA-binding NarL/FixJ family response regulator
MTDTASKARVALIADDHGLYRVGLSLLLKDALGFTEVLETGTFDDALEILDRRQDVRLALFDLSMPGMGGPESLSVVRSTYPQLKVAIVSASEDRGNIAKAVAASLGGYIPKSMPEAAIAEALTRIMAGQVFVPSSIGTVSVRPEAPPAPSPAAGFDALTPRQRDVLAGIVKGLSNKEIARELDIAEGTVKIHLAALFAHFAARNRTELATRAQAKQAGRAP